MILVSDHDNVDSFFNEFEDIINGHIPGSGSESEDLPQDNLSTYYNPKVEMYNEEDDLHIIFHDVDADDLENIKNIIRAFKGISNEYSEYFDHPLSYDDEEEEFDDTIGTQNIIPEGKYKGCTIQDAYNYHGHYSLSKLLQNVLRMTTITKDKQKDLYKELVQFTLPRMQAKVISLKDFIKAYAPFLKKYFDLDKINAQYDSLDAESRSALYDRILENITGRMKKSIE